MILSAEKFVADYLRAREDVGNFIGRRVVTKTPESTGDPWVRLTLIGAVDDPPSSVEYFYTFDLQCDCYAGATGGHPEAHALVSMVRSALKEMQGATIDDQVCTAVSFPNMVRVPDTDVSEPARERFVLDARIRLHALQDQP